MDFPVILLGGLIVAVAITFLLAGSVIGQTGKPPVGAGYMSLLGYPNILDLLPIILKLVFRSLPTSTDGVLYDGTL